MSLPPPLSASERPLAQVHDVVLLDLDGVVYVGSDAVPAAAVALQQVRAGGARLGFVTNNAARSPAAVAEHLVSLGVPASADDVVTSAQAAARVLRGRLPAGARVLVVGTDDLAAEVRDAGLEPVRGAGDDPVAVVQGYDPELGYGALAEATVAVRRGAWWVGCNDDKTVPSARGPLPGNGSLLDVVTAATGVRPELAGKPARPLLDEAVRRTAAAAPLFVGDRLDTDVAGARRAGMPSLAVLTGVSGVGDLAAAPPEQRPTYLARDVAGLLRAHPAATGVGGHGRCRGASARCDDAGHRVVAVGGPGGDGLDGLRAALALVWHLADSEPGAAAPWTLAGELPD